MPRFRIPALVLALLLAPGWAGAEQPGQGPPARNAPVTTGAAIVASPSPYSGVSSNLTPVPLLNLERGRFSLRGIQARYRLWQKSHGTLSAVVQPRLQSYDENDSPALAGMDSRRWTVEGGLRYSLQAGAWGFDLQGLTDLLGRHDGHEVTAGLDYRLVALSRFQLSPGAGVVWQSAALVDYYYGVRPDEARPGRPAFAGKAALSPYASLVGRLRLVGRWGLLAYARHTWLDDAITDSPIVARDTSYSGVLAITYAFF